MKIKVRSFEFVKNVIESYEEDDILNDFLNEFKDKIEIKYKEYFDFCYNYIDDMSEVYYIKDNWVNEY
jgi:hypothetical protein